ncbi:matrixin family metalloprotease [Nocardioides daeguensis]|nr:matrixin family metalloprotease [Nocardioides daeguensis]MBV6729346.1 matrixin family metalloprotease [Nocardioides daeguensis]MCR1774322.1 matrixin family metalloprotease [Nocardioides daeguensis]
MRGRRRWGVALLLSMALFGGVLVAGATGFGRPVPDPTYAFLEEQPYRAGEPVTWRPCEPIHYEVNPAHAAGTDDEAVARVRAAVAEVARASGFRFEYDGTTARRPGARTAPEIGRAAPVLVAWADADEVPDLAGDVAGVGGAATREEGRWFWYVTGGVVLDADALDGGADERATLLHELGHVLGLDHVDSRRELMYAESVGRQDFGEGDLRGLARLGKGTGSCS